MLTRSARLSPIRHVRQTFFMMTIVTTIGYGTFAPSLPFGRWMVILFGSVTIVLFGLVSRPAVDVIEAIEARTERLLLRARRSDEPLSEQGQKILKGASAMLLCHAILMAAAVIVYLDRDKEDPLHEEWDYGTCYYFCFVTFSSIGLGDFSLGPADNSNYELGRLLVQALIIMFGMAAFNVATGACSDLVLPLGTALDSQLRVWAVQLGTRVAPPTTTPASPASPPASPPTEPKLPPQPEPAPSSALPPKEPELPPDPCCQNDVKVYTHDAFSCSAASSQTTTFTQTTTINQTSTTFSPQYNFLRAEERMEERMVEETKVDVKKPPTADNTAEAQPSLCEPRLRACLAVIGYLAIFYAMILIGAAVFVHVEAATEEADAIAMRLEENEVRENMGLERLSVGALSGLPLSPPSAPPELRPASREEAAAALAALSQTPAEERGAALDSIVGDYVQVVKNEAAADSLAEFFLARLDTCKSRSADYTQPRWTFEGATFFMMTIATSIGYGTFAPKTRLGKAIVVLIGHLTMILYGVCLSALVNEVTATIAWVASMMLFVSGKVARVVRQCGGPELVASSEQEARYKLLVAIGLLHGYLGICAVCAQTVFGHYLDTVITFDEGYYFGFVTFSTIGFGDFALQPYGAPPSLVFFEALAIFAGLAFFSAFASHGAAWINEVALIAWPIAMDLRRLPRQLSHAFSTVQVASPGPPSPPTSASPLTSAVDNRHQPLRLHMEALPAKHEHPVPMPSCWDRALSRFTCFAAAILGMYLVIVLGGLCLYWSESDFERMGNCASMDEENELRTSIRLPPMVSEFC